MRTHDFAIAALLVLVGLSHLIGPATAEPPHYIVFMDAQGYAYIDIGSEQGIQPGMRFEVTRNGDGIGWLAVEAVAERFARTVVEKGEGMLPGDVIHLVPSADPIASEEDLPQVQPEPSDRPFPWFTLGKVLSVTGAVGSFYLAHQASERYVDATSIGEVSHYADQRDGYRRLGWFSISAGVVLIGFQWLKARL